MKDEPKTKEQLLKDIIELQKRVAELEKSEAARKQSKGAFRESEDRYQALFDRSLECLYVVDFEGNFIDANPTALGLLGYERADIPFLNIASVLHEDFLSKALKDLQEVIQTGFQKEVSEYKLCRKHGGYVDVEVKASVIFHDGSPHSILGIARDITDRKRVEESLRESEESYRNLFKNANEAIFVGLDSKIVFHNPKTTMILGYSGEELVSRPLSEFIHPDDRDMVIDCFVRQIKGEKIPQIYDFRIIHKDGNVRWVVLNSVVINWKGRPATLNFLSDITDRKLAEEALGESERKYRTILESIEEGYYEVDLDGNLTFFNDAMARINGYAREEMMGMNNRGYTDLENSKILYQAFNRVYRTRESSKGTRYEVITKNGEKRTLETSASLITDSSGKPIGFRGIARDVTELRQAQKALQESEDRYRDLVESSQDLMCTHDLQGQILWVNEEPARVLGYSRNAILKMNIRDLLVPERKGEFDEFLAAVRSQGMAKGLMTLQTAKGEKRIWEYHNTLRTEGVDEPIVRSISRDVTELIQAEREARETVKKLRKAMGGIIQAMALTVEIRDPYTAGHQHRVADLARAIAQEMSLSEDQVDGLRMAGIVHDLGKIGVPAEILSKASKLSDIEMGLLKIHPQISYDILKDIDFPWPVAQIVFQHHERINGSGYPLGLFGEDIYLEARILAVADVVEAIASHRPYRPSQGIDKALEEISINKGILYDPEVVDVCLRLFNEKGYQLK